MVFRGVLNTVLEAPIVFGDPKKLCPKQPYFEGYPQNCAQNTHGFEGERIIKSGAKTSMVLRVALKTGAKTPMVLRVALKTGAETPLLLRGTLKTVPETSFYILLLSHSLGWGGGFCIPYYR